MDTKIRCFIKPEVGHAEMKVSREFNQADRRRISAALLFFSLRVTSAGSAAKLQGWRS